MFIIMHTILVYFSIFSIINICTLSIIHYICAYVDIWFIFSIVYYI